MRGGISGIPVWDVAGYLGMTAVTLEPNFGHHHPDHSSEAVAGTTSKRARKLPKFGDRLDNAMLWADTPANGMRGDDQMASITGAAAICGTASTSARV